MVYGLLRISWVIAGSIRDETWLWEGISKGRKIVDLIPLTMLWVIWKERNNKVFDEMEEEFSKIRDRWLQYLRSLILSYSYHKGFWKCYIHIH